MLTYCLLNKDDMLNIMSSKSIELNLGNHILYSKLPCCNQDKFIFQLKLTYNKIPNLIKIDKHQFVLNESIQLENIYYKILYQNEEQKQFLKNMMLLYREMKFGKNEEINIKHNYLKCFNDMDTDTIELDKDDVLYNYESIKNMRVDRIKGMIYGLVSEPALNLQNIFENIPYYSERESIDAMMRLLRENKSLDRKLYNKFLSLKNELGRKLVETFISMDKNELLFSFNEFKKISFNNNYLKVTQLEKEIYEILINKIINYKNNNFGKDILHNVILEIINLIENNYNYDDLKQDIVLLKNRILYNDYIVNVNEIKSDLVKNIYAVYIKFNNVKELYSYIDSKEISKSYIALSIYGACQGFKNMPYSIIIDVDKNNLVLKIIKASLGNVYNNFYNLRYNLYYTRDKINLCINSIVLRRKEIRDYNFKDIKITIQESYSKYIIKINKPIIGTMNINIYNRKPNMANTIKFYDNKIRKLSLKYKNFEYDKNIYFTYSFINDSEYKFSNLQKEYYFSIILKEVYDNIKGGI